VKTRRDFLAAAAAAGAFSFPANSLLGQPFQSNQSTGPAAHYGLEPGLIYLNTGSAGPTPNAVLQCTLDAWAELEKNPVVNEYSLDGVLGSAEKVRESAGAFLGCAKDELLLTRSTSEGMNILAQSILLRAGERVLISDQEHTGGSDCWRYLAERHGIIVDKVAVPYDAVDPQAIVQRFADAIQPATRVISFSHILYTTGLRMPVSALAALARSRNLLCIVDGAQAAGATPVDVKALGCHAYATTGHKWLMGPKGVSMLYISSEAADEIKPIQWTGGKKYVDNSIGVGPLPLVVGLGAAIEQANALGVAKIEAHNLALRDRAFQGLRQIPSLTMMSPPAGPLVSAIVSFALPSSIDNRDMLHKLRFKHSIMTRAIEKEHFNGLRISPHRFNTESEVDALLSALKTELS
jgi:selenocysteine lyase/cysteine desulfurase